jgi:hypothetical protein
VNTIDRPPGDTNKSFQLVAPYSRNPSEWLDLDWIDIHSGEIYRIRTNEPSDRLGIRVQTMGDVLDRFRMHPEAKSCGLSKEENDRDPVGLLGRLNVQVETIRHIGKETNLIEQHEAGVVLADPLTVYVSGNDSDRMCGLLKRVSLREVARESGVSERMLRNLRKGDRHPSADTIRRIEFGLSRCK